MRLDLALHHAVHIDGARVETQGGLNRFRSCQRRREGNFLQPPVAVPLQPLHQVGQVTPAIALYELVYFVNDDHPQPLQKRLYLAVRAAEHDVQRFWRGEQHVSLSRRQAFDIADANAQPQPQALMQDRLQAAPQILCQGPCRHHVQDRRGTTAGQDPFQAWGQDRGGFATASGGLHNDIVALQDGRNNVTLEGPQGRKGAIESAVGIGQL